MTGPCHAHTHAQGGAPVEGCPVKLTPTVKPLQRRTLLDVIYDESTFNANRSVSDY